MMDMRSSKWGTPLACVGLSARLSAIARVSKKGSAHLKRRYLVVFLFAAAVASLQAQAVHPLQSLIGAARANATTLRDLLPEAIPTVKQSGGAAVWGQDFLFAVETERTPTVAIDRQPPATMTRVEGTNLWYKLAKLRVGVTHHYEFFADGKSMGNAYRYDVAGYNPDSYPQPAVRSGSLSEKKTLVSSIYPEMSADYWVYVNHGYDASRGGPLMVWQDGERIAGVTDHIRLRLRTVTDNLVHQKLIPPMVHVLIAPGNGKEAKGTRMRSIQYDTVSDRYGRYLIEEVLPEVEKTYKLRSDAYSRGIGGLSSGAICALNAAWYFPTQFSRVHSNIGSYVALQWRPEQHQDGGYIYPYKVLREPKRNLRVWLADGSEDNESLAGSWPLQNIQLANAFKLRGYDFHFRFGDAMHSVAQAALDLPESLVWLWRDYDPAKSEQTYEMDRGERDKPLYRVKIVNREAW
jgi:enterochelin esterase family protein